MDDEERLKRALEETERSDEDFRVVPVAATVRSNPRNVFSLRMRADELDLLASAAEEVGVTLSEYVRKAALAKARGEASERGEVLRRLDAIESAIAQVLSRFNEHPAVGSASRPV